MARITVEDCLKQVHNRFALVRMATIRAKDILNGAPTLTESENKAVVTALREIAAGEVRMKEPTDEEATDSKVEIQSPAHSTANGNGSIASTAATQPEAN